MGLCKISPETSTVVILSQVVICRVIYRPGRVSQSSSGCVISVTLHMLEQSFPRAREFRSLLCPLCLESYNSGFIIMVYVCFKIMYLHYCFFFKFIIFLIEGRQKFLQIKWENSLPTDTRNVIESSLGSSENYQVKIWTYKKEMKSTEKRR